MLFYILQLLGLLPVSRKELPFSGSVLRSCKYKLLYSVCIIVFLSTACILAFSSFLSDLKKTHSKEIFISLVLDAANANAPQISCILCLLLVMLQVQKKIDILEKCREVDFLLQRRQQNSFLKLRYVSCLVILHVLSFILSISIKSTYGILIKLTQPCKLITACAAVEFMEVILGVKERFELFNKLLKEVLAKKSSNEVWTVSLPCVESFLERPKKKSLNIQQLRIVHWRLCVLVRDISDTYGFTLLVLLSALFIHLTFFTNSLVVLVNKGNDTSLLRVFSNLNMLIMYFSQLYIIVWPCTLVISEAIKTKSDISLMMFSIHQTADKSDHLFNQLGMFSDQMILQKIHISVFGMFSVEAFTVVPIVSAVTTYLAIILQVQSSVDN